MPNDLKGALLSTIKFMQTKSCDGATGLSQFSVAGLGSQVFADTSTQAPAEALQVFDSYRRRRV